METVNIRSLRTIAKIVGTAICVGGAMSMALLKGPKLLNAEFAPSKSIIMMKSSSSSVGEKWLLGCLFLFASSSCWSIWLILQVPASASHPNHLSLSAWMCFMATIQSAAVTLFLEPDPNAWKINSLLEFGCALFAGVMGSSVCFFLQAWCVTRRGPLFSAMFSPLLTVITAILAAIALHEELYTGSLIGGIGVIVGLYVVLWGKAEAEDQQAGEEVKVLINEKAYYCKSSEPLLSSNS